MQLSEARQRILERPLVWSLLRFGSPLAVGMGLQVTFNLVDAYMVSRLGQDESSAALGAIGICDQVAAIGSIISYGLSTAAATIVSHRCGAGDLTGARKVAWQSTLLVLLLGLVFGLVGIGGAGFIMADFIAAKGRVLEMGTEYLRVIVGGNVTIFLLLHWTTMQRALGSSKTPVAFVLLSSVLNFALAVLLVYGPGQAPAVLSWGPALARALSIPRMGLLGAAWATVMARVAVLLPLLLILMRRFGVFSAETRGPLEKRLALRLCDLAWPASIQLVMRILAMLVVQSLVARAYTTAADQAATTALGVVFRLETMALFVSLGWGGAAQTFVGQNLGASHPRRATQSAWLAAVFNSVMMLTLATIYVVGSRSIVEFFDADPEVVRLGVSYLHVVTFSYVGLGIGIVLGSALQGAGLPRLALLTDSSVLLGVLLPALVLVGALRLSVSAIWTTVAVSYGAFAVAYVAVFIRPRLLESGRFTTDAPAVIGSEAPVEASPNDITFP